jgi:hypothetical protein
MFIEKKLIHPLVTGIFPKWKTTIRSKTGLNAAISNTNGNTIRERLKSLAYGILAKADITIGKRKKSIRFTILKIGTDNIAIRNKKVMIIFGPA